MILADRLRMAGDVTPPPPALSVRYMGRNTVVPNASGDGTVTVTNTAASEDRVVAVVMAWDANNVGTNIAEVKAGGSGGTTMRVDRSTTLSNYVGVGVYSIADPGGSTLDVWVNATSGADTIVVALYAIEGGPVGGNSAYYGREAVVDIARNDSDDSSPTSVTVSIGSGDDYVTVGGVIGWKAGGTAETLTPTNVTTDFQTAGTQFTYAFFSEEGAHSTVSATVSSAHTALAMAGVRYKLEQA